MEKDTSPESESGLPLEPDQPNVKLPNREYVRQLGVGGQGQVWLVRNIKMRGRLEAVKIVPAPVQDVLKSPDYGRFLREIDILAEISHSNIVMILDADPERGYYIMEYLEGGSLEEKLKSGMSVEEGLEIVRRVGEALKYAHGKGLAHRDLKPQNVMFTDEGVPKITDFGLAKLPGQETLTHTRQAMGSFHYMPPEQFEDAKKADHRADIWALGVILYRVLTGRVPFPEASEMYNVLYALTQKEIPRPGEVAKLGSLGQRLEPVCLKALEKDVAERYQQVEDMLQDLDRAQRGEVVGVSQPGHRVKSWLVATVVILLLCLGLGVWHFQEENGGPVRDGEPESQEADSGTLDEPGEERPVEGAVVDKTGPVIRILAPAPDATLREKQAELRGTVSDALSPVKSLKINDTAVEIKDGAFTWHWQVKEGENTVLVWAEDEAGNSTEKTYSWPGDPLPPEFTLEGPRDRSRTYEASILVKGRLGSK